jgi:hypothetical protein
LKSSRIQPTAAGSVQPSPGFSPAAADPLT